MRSLLFFALGGIAWNNQSLGRRCCTFSRFKFSRNIQGTRIIKRMAKERFDSQMDKQEFGSWMEQCDKSQKSFVPKLH